MKPTLTLAVIAGSSLLVLGLLSCSPDSPAENGSEAPSKAISGSSGGDSQAGGGPAIPQVEIPQAPPILAFEKNSLDLPVGGSWREHPTLGDLDGDSFADLIASNREENGLNIWRSQPGKAWEPKLEGIAVDLMYGGSDHADLDGDGDIDFVFASHNLGLRSFLNDGDMKWTEVKDAANSTFLALDVALGNLNGDEFPDAATVAQFATNRMGALGIYFGLGDGHFEFRPEYRNITDRSRFGVQIELADVTGNGLDDVLLTAEKGCMLFFTTLSDDGQVIFENRSTGLPLPPSNMGNALRSFAPIDIDGESPLEVAFASLVDPALDPADNYSLGILRWNADQESWEPFGSGLPDGLAYSDVLSADFNGDRFDDLLVIGTDRGATIYLGDGAGNFRLSGMLEGTLAGGRGAIGDIDGDGKPDVAVICGSTKARPTAGAVNTFLNRDAAWK